MAFPEDLQRASVIASCANPLPDNIISQYGKRIIRHSDHHVVKWGPDVTKEEYENQRIAYELVDNRIARVPRVYDFFLDVRGWGYIVMEFIEGKIIDPLDDASVIQRVASVLDHFDIIFLGACRGLIFPETDDLVFDSLDRMEKWFNSRLFAHNPILALQGCELVLCHLDIAPRNILWPEDGSLCLLDWASAGFYPRLFEFCVQWIVDRKDGDFNSLLLQLVKPLSDYEMAQKDAILCAWRNIQKYPFQNTESMSRQRLSRHTTDLPPVPAHPMPEYPLEWCKQAERECSIPTRSTIVAPQTSVAED
ncbi:kinase-like protein [Penicillium nucicola]|uniref:kinase-like protein n=1 Tax=Penicillium nucicola TaxID=1850975 RepID=UPI0025457886|nr:kinase-like protein [Penicillium nucicola]KAJ5757736.1 kinase-like protein [Penicillium nucicola]